MSQLKAPARTAILVALALAGASASAPHALASRHRDRGGIAGAAGRYSVVFGLDEARPNPRFTPGALNPAVEQGNIHETICRRGYSRSIRPPEEYTERLKRVGIRQYRYSDRRLRDYEEDHLLCLVIELLRTGAVLENSPWDARRDTRSVAQRAGFPFRDSGSLA